jgi:hypothetical protein
MKERAMKNLMKTHTAFIHRNYIWKIYKSMYKKTKDLEQCINANDKMHAESGKDNQHIAFIIFRFMKWNAKYVKIYIYIYYKINVYIILFMIHYIQ